MTFLAAHAGGHPSGCPHRAGLILSKKRKKEEEKGEKKRRKRKIALAVPFLPVSLGQGEAVSSLSPLSEAGPLPCFVPVLSFLVASPS